MKTDYIHAAVEPCKSRVHSTKFDDIGSTTSYNGLNVPAGVQLINHSVDTTIQTARVGLNYRFGGPVVARY